MSTLEQIEARTALGHRGTGCLMAFIDRDPDRWVYAEYEELRAACLTALAERPTAVEDPFDAYAMLPYEQRVALIERIACA